MKSGYDQHFKKVQQTAKNVRGSMPKGKAKQRSAAVPTDAEVAIRQALGLKQAARRPKLKPAKISTVVGAAAVMGGLGVMVWLALEPSRLDHWLERVEIGIFGETLAAESGGSKSEKSAEAGPAKEEKSSSSESRGPQAVGETVPHDLSYYAKLNEKREELDLREKELGELEEELHKQKAEVEARIQHLEGLREQIAGVLKEKVEVDQEKVNRLVEFYSNMKPQQAAKVIGTLNEDLAIEVLGKMKKKSAAEIMNLLEPDKAQVLSEKFAGYKRR